MSGLHVVPKQRTGGVRFYVYAWRGGPQIHVQDDTRPAITPALIDLAAQARQGRSSIRADSLDAVIDAYRESPEYERLRPATKVDYRLWLDRVSERFGSAPLAIFNDTRVKRDIIEWRNRWAKQPRTADKAVAMLSTVLGYALDNGMVAANIAAGIKTLHRVKLADRIWEDRHWQAVADVPAHVMDALELARLTGLRIGDLVSLEWGHVTDKSVVMITAKREGRAVIPIYPELRAHLDAREHREGAVLRTSRGEAWTVDGLQTAWQRAKPKGFDRRFHDLRGTYVTWLAMKGLSDNEIAYIVGWTAKRVADIRARYVDENRVVVSLIERLSA